MTGFRTAISAEWMKFRNALLPRMATIGLVAVPSLVSPMSTSSRGGQSALAAADWAAYFDMSAGTVATGGLFGFGLVIVWLFGREFVDGTIAGLFGLPVRLGQIALAKIVLFTLWACAVTAMLSLALLCVGAAIGLGAFDGAALAALARFGTVSVLTASLTVPFALVATLSRDYLAPIGVILGVVILTSVLAQAGLGGWLPYAAPGMWAGAGGAGDPIVIAIQLANVVILAALFAGLVVRRWKRLEI